jgi:hypothetical protein
MRLQCCVHALGVVLQRAAAGASVWCVPGDSLYDCEAEWKICWQGLLLTYIVSVPSLQ